MLNSSAFRPARSRQAFARRQRTCLRAQLFQRETFIGSAALFRICQVLRLRPGSHEPGHPQADTRRVFVCACTHYLVFKEPTASPPISRRVPEQPSVREPFNVTAAGSACQPLISWLPTFSFGVSASGRRLGNLTRVSTARPLVNTFPRERENIFGCFGTGTASCAAIRVRGRKTEYAEARPLSNQPGPSQDRDRILGGGDPAK